MFCLDRHLFKNEIEFVNTKVALISDINTFYGMIISQGYSF